jgi:glycosyltransferase involved in cell wall biosynthesis
MRVLLVAAALPPARCGIGDYSERLAQVLAERGHWTPVVLTTTAKATSDYFEIVHSDPTKIGFRDALNAIRLVRPDVVHIQYPSTAPISSLVPVAARRISGLPVVQTWHEHFRECIQLSWMNLLGLDALVYVRDNLPPMLPPLVAHFMKGKLAAHIPNASSIRPATLSPVERDASRSRIAGQRQTVVFFGFAHPNKGVHLLFDIANPDRHHIVLITQLDSQNDYQRAVLERSASPPWCGHVTVTGFLPEQEVAKTLAAADAVVFPFPEGIGAWNTSVLAAMESGALVVGTTRDSSMAGYDAKKNVYLAPCGDIASMREGLATHIGQRNPVSTAGNSWTSLASAHEALYEALV